ncbi:Retrovirus-related Pol polyprotein from transposon RE1 [Sesamum angolense]|uniref:Retrovirus-related Pol polyprotein from transposon RE1 n=1 Tax=Sesamum angolense TaxID=2727404 RepID=A0AAE2BTM0_9LAMI|nr:Retrovirus-related Pol polyprotein from transposon RE1 [Sesamum angolense]
MAGEEVRTDSAPSTNMQQEQNDLCARSTTVAAIQTDMEDLRVHTSDHPGMVLVADPLRQIASISQGNMDVVSYYTKLRMLWDELECIDPTPDCDCSSQRTLANKLASNQLMQFLMGLNDSFDAIRNQILVMDPLPVVDKAYSLVLRVESQRQGQMHIKEANTNAALLAKNMDVTRDDQRTKRILAVGKLIGELYTLDRDSFNTDVISRHSITNVAECLLNVTVTETDLWHRRLGHTPILVMKRANVLKANTDDLSICQTCPLAKQQRLSFLITEIHSKHVFELIHVDIWGPYNQFSLSGCAYMLTIVDDFSRATWVFLMKHKSQSISILQNFYQMILTQFDKMIKVVTYSVLQWKSPYEVLYNKPVDYSVLKVFGCLAFATNLQPHKSKFAKRAHRCIFVGYAPGQKGYTLFDLDDNVMLISRDVVFHEQVFPFKNSHATADSGSMPIPAPLPEDSYISTPTSSATIQSADHPLPVVVMSRTTNEVPASMVSPAPTSSDTSASSPVHTDPSSPVHTLRRSTEL